MTWKDSGDCSRVCRGITNEEGSQDICRVWTRREVFSNDAGTYKWNAESWPEGEANFALILKAPLMLEALEEIEAVRLITWGDSTDIVRAYNKCKAIARAAIAAVKGE